jgi:hypothetical protein
MSGTATSAADNALVDSRLLPSARHTPSPGLFALVGAFVGLAVALTIYGGSDYKAEGGSGVVMLGVIFFGALVGASVGVLIAYAWRFITR